MPLEERDRALIYDMLDAARHLRLMWQGHVLSELLNDRTLQWATDRGFNIIGEAARQVSDMTKAEYADIDRRRIVALRNVIVHDYGDVDYARHWRVIHEDLPKLLPGSRGSIFRPDRIIPSRRGAQ
jgi:uncharacterized protein with HEPN domain